MSVPLSLLAAYVFSLIHIFIRRFRFLHAFHIQPGSPFPEPKFVPLDMQETTLPNGAKLFVIEDHKRPLTRTPPCE